jgi:hypothetical protein
MFLGSAAVSKLSQRLDWEDPDQTKPKSPTPSAHHFTLKTTRMTRGFYSSSVQPSEKRK